MFKLNRKRVRNKTTRKSAVEEVHKVEISLLPRRERSVQAVTLPKVKVAMLPLAPDKSAISIAILSLPSRAAAMVQMVMHGAKRLQMIYPAKKEKPKTLISSVTVR